MKKTFVYQNDLPRIPIPELTQTCDKFIEWVQPLLTEEEFTRTKEIAERFKSEGGDGEKLQRELVKWSNNNHVTNWIAPFWEDLYLEQRIPLIKEGNVFYLMKNNLKDLKLSQIETAAALILSILKFKSLIDREELEVDLQNGDPICMEQYKRLFCAARIPKKKRDELKLESSQRHIIVIYEGSIFSVNVFGDTGEPKTYAEIKDDLESILSASWGAEGEGVGILTTMSRDRWADTREYLLKIDSTNYKHVKKIESSIFALCLDDSTPESLEDTSKLMLHGNGKNRWFDKSLQFIVSKDGEIGINMEHTGIDGSVMSSFIKFIYNDMDGTDRSAYRKIEEKPEKLIFCLNDKLIEVMNAAADQFKNIVSDQETRVVVFDEFGTRFIKTFKISPDAFVQLALQLAQYKLYGRCYSAYEAVMTRKFLHGRIEVMYSVSQESIEFIKNMTAVSCEVHRKRNSFIKAAQKHVDRIKECQNGMGVDGHLMALLKIHERFGKIIGLEAIPEMFTDKGYKMLTHSTICTSTTSSCGLELAGWGPVVEDGFGIRYIKDRDEIRFNITSRKYMEKKLDKLVSYIQESLVEMAELMKG